MGYIMLRPFGQIPVYIQVIIMLKKGLANMLPNDLHFLAHQERYKDLVREAAQERLVRGARNQQQRHGTTYQVITSWIGFYLERWGCILQPYTNACSCC